ncbi:MAG: methylmalonyl-CoA epimerase [Candidatus Hodarchaeales archaeon]|jgi:methylmalonyl-CoA/ethylmalonyl-CoA epimerase
MVKKIAHIGIAVENLAESVSIFEQLLGTKCRGIEDVPTQKVKVAFLPVGETNIELLEGTAPDSPITKFLEKQGSGVHHLAFEVQDLKTHLKILKDAGVRLIDQEPRSGAHGTKIAFIHPKETGRVLCELVEMP